MPTGRASSRPARSALPMTPAAPAPVLSQAAPPQPTPRTGSAVPQGGETKSDRVSGIIFSSFKRIVPGTLQKTQDKPLVNHVPLGISLL